MSKRAAEIFVGIVLLTFGVCNLLRPDGDGKSDKQQPSYNIEEVAETLKLVKALSKNNPATLKVKKRIKFHGLGVRVSDFSFEFPGLKFDTQITSLDGLPVRREIVKSSPKAGFGYMIYLVGYFDDVKSAALTLTLNRKQFRRRLWVKLAQKTTLRFLKAAITIYHGLSDGPLKRNFRPMLKRLWRRSFRASRTRKKSRRTISFYSRQLQITTTPVGSQEIWIDIEISKRPPRSDLEVKLSDFQYQFPKLQFSSLGKSKEGLPGWMAGVLAVRHGGFGSAIVLVGPPDNLKHATLLLTCNRELFGDQWVALASEAGMRFFKAAISAYHDGNDRAPRQDFHRIVMRFFRRYLRASKRLRSKEFEWETTLHGRSISLLAKDDKKQHVSVFTIKVSK